MVDDFSKGFGVRLRALRESRGWGRSEVPGCTQFQILTWEQGKALARPAEIVRLAKLFGVTTDHLLCGEEATPEGNPRDAQGTLLLSRAAETEIRAREVIPFRLDREGSWGQRVDAFWIVNARGVDAVPVLQPGDVLLLQQLTPNQGPPDDPACLLAWVKPGQRLELFYQSEVKPVDGQSAGVFTVTLPDGRREAVGEQDTLYWTVAVARRMWAVGKDPWATPSAPGAEVEWFAAQRGLPVVAVGAVLRILEAALASSQDVAEPAGGRRGQADEAKRLVERSLQLLQDGDGSASALGETLNAALQALRALDGSEPRKTTADGLAEIGAEAVSLIDGGSTDARLVRALREAARQLGPLLRESSQPPNDLVRMAEAARVIGVSRQAVQQAVMSRRLPTYGEGKVRLVSLREARMLVGGPVPGVARAGREAGGDGQGAAPESMIAAGMEDGDSSASTATPDTGGPRRVLLADIVADRTVRFEPGIRDSLREWAPWVDAEPDDETYRRNIANPPEDTPPPFDYNHYDEWETVMSAAHGLQWWEYEEGLKREQFAAFVRRMETTYRTDPSKRGRMWESSWKYYGPFGALPSDDDEKA